MLRLSSTIAAPPRGATGVASPLSFVLRDAPSAVSSPPSSPAVTITRGNGAVIATDTPPAARRCALVPANRPVEGGSDRGRRPVHDRLPHLAAAHRRPRRAHLPRRPVRPGGLHDLERPVVRRPPHARLQRAVPAARVAAHPAGGARASRRWRRRRSSPPLARGAFGDERARWGAIWFGAASATLLFTSRLPFAIGVAFGLAALLALQRHRYWLAILFAILCPLGSPVAGLFLAMAGVAYAIAERHDRLKRCEGLAIAAAAFLPPVFLSWAFPEGGWAPFPTSAYVPIPALRAGVPDRSAAQPEGAALGRRPLRAGRHRGARARDADGRQRRPPRRAVRRPRPPVCALGPAVDAGAGGRGRYSWPASRASRSGSGRPRCAT